MSHIVYPEDYGAVGDGTTDDHSAIVSAVAASAQKTLVFCPGKAYLFDPSETRIDVSDRHIVATGATLKNAYFGVSSGTSKWEGGHVTQDGSADNYNSPKFLISGGSGHRITDLRCTNVTSYAALQLSGANDVVVRDLQVYQNNLNSITITAGTKLRLSGINIEGNPSGSDDGIALVDGGDICDVVITDVTAKNVYDILKIVNSSNDVRNVVVNGCSGTNVTAPLYIQSQGAVAENIVFANCAIYDESGVFAENLVRFDISGGAIVRNVRVSSLTFRGRTYPVNNDVVLLKNVDSTICGLEISGLRWDDIYSGAANGGGTPGHPAVEAFRYVPTGGASASDVSLYDWLVTGAPGMTGTASITNLQQDRVQVQ